MTARAKTSAAASPVGTLVAARAGRASRSRRRPETPAELAARIVPGYRVTPTIALVSNALAEAVAEPGRRLIVTVPPREGKSTLVSQIGPPYALMADRDSQVVLASYADALAQEHSGEARARITEHAALLGFQLRGDKQVALSSAD